MFNKAMEYEEAKALKAVIEAQNHIHSEVVKFFDKYGKTALGLTPDFVKAMPEYKEARTAYDLSFAKLRAFNGWFVKRFKKECAADRQKAKQDKAVIA